MKIGARAHDFGRMTADKLAETIKEAGFDCVQLAFTKAIEGVNSFDQITPKHLIEAEKAFSKADLEITVFGSYIEPSLADSKKRLEQVEIFNKNLVNAKNLNVKIVGTETTELGADITASEREKAYQLLKDSVLRMVEAAERENMWIGIEPVAEHTLNTPELTRRLFDEVGSNKLKVIFDPVNMISLQAPNEQKRVFTETFNLLGEEIVVLHVKDTIIENNEKTWRKIGSGIVDYGFIMDWLKKNKPDMRLLREGVEMDSYKEDRDAMKCLAGLL